MIHRPPHPPLDLFVESLWYHARPALAHAREINLPTGCADIVIALQQPALTRFAGVDDAVGQQLAGGLVQGAHARSTMRGTDAASSVVGVHFRPGGACALLGGALPSLFNRSVSLDDLWGTACASALVEHLREAATPSDCLTRLEGWLLSRLQPESTLDPLVSFALARFSDRPADARVDAVQQASGLSPQQFITRFERSVGITPKRYARVLRFRSLVSRLAEAAPASRPPWAELALDAGYSDQSHLIHEFTRLAGIRPTAYRPVSEDQPSHVAVQGDRPE